MFTILEGDEAGEGASGSAFNLSGAKAASFWLSVTADESTTADKLNVWLQSSQDGGTTWQDFGRFTEQAGDVGSTGLVQILKWVRGTNETEATTPTDAGTGFTEGSVINGPIGPKVRAKSTVTDDSTSAAFTYAVAAQFSRK